MVHILPTYKLATFVFLLFNDSVMHSEFPSLSLRCGRGAIDVDNRSLSTSCRMLIPSAKKSG